MPVPPPPPPPPPPRTEQPPSPPTQAQPAPAPPPPPPPARDYNGSASQPTSIRRTPPPVETVPDTPSPPPSASTPRPPKDRPQPRQMNDADPDEPRIVLKPSTPAPSVQASPARHTTVTNSSFRSKTSDDFAATDSRRRTSSDGPDVAQLHRELEDARNEIAYLRSQRTIAMEPLEGPLTKHESFARQRSSSIMNAPRPGVTSAPLTGTQRAIRRVQTNSRVGARIAIVDAKTLRVQHLTVEGSVMR